MRNWLLAFGLLLFVSGAASAKEVTLLKFDKKAKTLSVSEEDEKEYKVTSNTKFIVVDKVSGESVAITYDDAVKGLTNPKAEGNLKFDITVKDDGDEILEMKLPGRKKK